MSSVDVMQADRDAAADLVKWQQKATDEWEAKEPAALHFFAKDFSRAIRQGIWDEHPVVQAFARHRLAEREWCAGDTARLERQKDYAIRWANQSVEMLQSAFFPVADALRALEAYLRDTPHHSAPEAAAARKALSVFEAAETPDPARSIRGDA